MKDFARRLKQTCDDNPLIPEYGHGRQVFISNKLKVTQEAVRKWFTGESRPRPEKMKALATLLEVDEAWLSLGIQPELDRKQKRQLSEKTEGAVYVTFGLFTLSGGHCAFPGEKDPRRAYVDFYVIAHGAQMAVHISTGRLATKDRWEFFLPREYNDVRCLGVVPLGGMKFHIIDLDQRLIEDHKMRKAGGYSLLLGSREGVYASGGDTWPRIKHIGDL